MMINTTKRKKDMMMILVGRFKLYLESLQEVKPTSRE